MRPAKYHSLEKIVRVQWAGNWTLVPFDREFEHPAGLTRSGNAAFVTFAIETNAF